MIREKIILQLIKDKEVLDIGSTGQTSAYSLWNILKRAATKSLTGIDLTSADEDAKKYFNVQNPEMLSEDNILKGNMETYSFDKKFDVVIAGDVIEHVENQGLFLNNIRNHLKPEGILILTTPNAKWFTVLSKPNPTHTLWHDKSTLKRILECCGFVIIDFKYYPGNKEKYFLLARPLIIRQNMLVICKMKHSDTQLISHEK